jgi:hypothetical protein
MIDLGIGFNEMQWLVLVIFASTIFFKIGMRAGVEKAIVFVVKFKDKKIRSRLYEIWKNRTLENDVLLLAKMKKHFLG